MAGTGGERTLTAALDNQGTLTISPGASGILTIAGSLTTSGIINLELSGASSFDQLVVTGGSATLGGTLNVTLINGFTPQVGQTFTILTSTLPRSGTFGTNLPGTMSAQYNANSVVLMP